MLASTALVLGWLACGPAPRQRTVAPLMMAAPQPFRSDEKFDYFKVLRRLDVTLTKPMGAVLEEGKAGGVVVDDLQDGGSAAETGLLKKGDRLSTVMGTDVMGGTLDEVMDLLVNAPEEVELGVRRMVISRKPRAPPHELIFAFMPLWISSPFSWMAVRITTPRSTWMVSPSTSSDGGAGQCSSCWVEVLEGAENLSERTGAELTFGARQKKPDSWRMACQTFVDGPAKVEVKSLGK